MSSKQPDPPDAILGHNHSEIVLRREIWTRLNVDNEHFMGAIVGREGSGKSLTAVAIASLVDPDFTADDVYFDPQDLLEAFDSDDYSRGSVIIMDEAGVGLGNRSWYDKEQILLNQTLQTVRDDNMGVLFTLPRLEELDSQTIGRLHAMIEMEGVVDGEYATARWKNIELSRDGRGDVYKKYPRYLINGARRRISQIGIGRPPAEIEETYEERKAAFKEELYEEAIGAYESDDSGDSYGPKEAAQEIAEDGIAPFVSLNDSTNQPYINKELIRVEYDLSHNDASAVKSLLKQSFSDSEIEDKI